MGAPFRQPEWSALALLEAPDSVPRAHARVHRGRRRGDHHQLLRRGAVPHRRGALRRPGPRAGGPRRPAGARGSRGRRRPVRVAGSLPPLFGSYRPDLFEPERAPGAAGRPDRRPGAARRPVAGRDAELDRRGDGRRDGAGRRRPAAVGLLHARRRPGPERRGCAPARASPTAAPRSACGSAPRRVLFNCCQPEIMAGAVSRAARCARRARPAARRLRQRLPADARGPRGQRRLLSDIRADLDPDGYCAFAQDVGGATAPTWSAAAAASGRSTSPRSRRCAGSGPKKGRIVGDAPQSFWGWSNHEGIKPRPACLQQGACQPLSP